MQAYEDGTGAGLSPSPSEGSSLLKATFAPSSPRQWPLLVAATGTLAFAATSTALLVLVALQATGSGDFQMHIVLMPVAFALCAPLGAVTWRVLPAFGASRDLTKVVHALFMSAAALFAVLGVLGIYRAHANNVERELTTWGEVHLQSSHSWIGTVAVTLFVANSVGGLLYFYTPRALVPDETRRGYVPVHSFLGFVSVGLTLLSVPMGIMSYAFRGTLEHAPNDSNASALNMIQGGHATSIEYKFGALAIVGLMVSIALVFFISSKPATHAR